MLIKTFEEISKADVKLAGGKGASLGEMLNAGFPVPTGFVITTDVFIQFHDKDLPADIEEVIFKAFDNLKTERVAVRSSAVAEDSSTASWAGQLESYLNITKDNLIDSIKKCWNSISSDRALSYAKQQNLPGDRMEVAVIVQKMVDSEVAGVMFTVNPVNKNKKEMMIEAVYGLGEKLVQGMMIPDNFLVDKTTMKIISKNIQSKETLFTKQLEDLVVLGKKIEDYFKAPQDIEWALEKGRFYILQSRPITTL